MLINDKNLHSFSVP